jgi:hypothetical protein
MKRITVFALTMILVLQLFSQTVSHISFTYDDAGNRLTRQVIYLKTSEVEDVAATYQTAFGQLMDSVEYKGTLGSLEISIFPNPTKGSLTIAMAGAQETGPATLVLFSLKGEVILQQEIRQPSTTLDLSGHPPGTYLLQITTAAGRETWKVVKE